MKTVELFSGAGGLGLGISKAGFRPAAIIEWDRWCCDTIRENRARKIDAVAHWPEPTNDDVRKISFDRFEGKIELVSGGPPCQPFSLGGKHRGRGDERDMWPQAVRAVREIKPKAFIFENVKGLTRATFASYLDYIVLQLTHPMLMRRKDEDWLHHLARLERHHTSKPKSDVQYQVVYRVLNAADYGIPQKRERVFFVGFRNDLSVEWSFPEATHSREALIRDMLSGNYWERHLVPRKQRTMPKASDAQVLGSLVDDRRRSPWKTVRDAVQGLPDPEKMRDSDRAFANHKYQAGARSYPGHTGSLLDEPAKALKAGVHGVPGGENMLLKPDGGVRYFTVRESARLQTFPDQFVFHGSWTETMRQLGNAVPVELAATIATSVGKNLSILRSPKVIG